MSELAEEQNEKQVWRKILNNLELGELRTVAFDLEIKFDNLAGDTLNKKVMSLLDLLEKQERFTEFKAYVFTESEYSFLKNNYLSEVLDLKRRDITNIDTAESPYRGLEAFQEAHAHIFFGRQTLSQQLSDKLHLILKDKAQTNFLSIIGASGSGKSSLVRAGILPELRKLGWPIYVMTPTAHPLESLARTLTTDRSNKLQILQMKDGMAQDTRVLNEYMADIIASHTPEQKQIVLLIDQFEELFTLCNDLEIREKFVESLLYVLKSDQSKKLCVLLTLRADFYHQVAWSDGLRLLLQQQQAYIGRMSREELQQAIEGPAMLYDYRLQEGLVKQILDDVGNEPGNLPLLSHALHETWTFREGTDGKELTLAGYTKAGGVKGAIARTADAELTKFGEQEKVIARNIFMRLTELGKSAEDTRRRASLTELIPEGSDSEVVLQVLARLTSARLITAGQNDVEVSHEALIREWDTLREWLDADRDGLRLLEQLSRAATFWDENGREDTDLYTGTRLGQTLVWRDKQQLPLSQLETLYLRVSQQTKEQAEQEELKRAERERAQKEALEAEKEKRVEEAAVAQARSKRQRWIIASVIGLIILACPITIYTIYTSQQAFTSATDEVYTLQQQAAEAQMRANDIGIQATEDAITAQATADSTSSQATVDAATRAAPPIVFFSNEPPTDITLSADKVQERNVVNTSIASLTAEDPDPSDDDFSFRLTSGEGDTNNRSFLINGDQLIARNSFRFAETPELHILVEVNDGNGGSYREAFVIEVVINENEKFSSPYYILSLALEKNRANTLELDTVAPQTLLVELQRLQNDSEFEAITTNAFTEANLSIDVDEFVSFVCLQAGENIAWETWTQEFADDPYRLTCPQYPVHPSVPEENQPSP